MKILRILFVAIFSFVIMNTWAQSAQTMHQVFTPEAGRAKLTIDVMQNVENIQIRKTQGTRVMVETTVKISIPNDKLLAYLIESGRYNLVESTNESENSYYLSWKKTNNVIMIKGEECIEDIIYVIYVPESIPSVVIKNNSGVVTAKVE